MKFIFLILASFLTSCSMLKPHMDVNHVKSVKTVAVVAFEVQQDQPTDNLGLGGLKKMFNKNKETYTPEQQKMTQRIYKNLVDQIKSRTGWNVMNSEQIMAKELYSSLVEQKMSGARITSPTEKGAILIDHKGLLDVVAFRRMSVEEKQQLAKDLGVDALVEVIISQNIDQSWYSLGHLTGTAAFKYRSRAHLQMYSLNNFEKPIWRIQNIDGEQFSSKNLSKNIRQKEKVIKVGFQAAKSSIKKLMSNYKL